MDQNYTRYDLRRNSKCRWSDNELYQSRHSNNPQYKHIYAHDGKGRVACFTARVPSNRVQKAPSEQESGYSQLKEVLKFYKPPEISSCAIHPPKSSSRVKYDVYPKMYAKHRVDHDIQYKESCIDENLGLMDKGKRTQYTNTPYSFLVCSEYLKQRLDRKSTLQEVVQDVYCKNKDLTVKPETRDVSCGNILIRTTKKKRSGKRLKRVSTSKRIKRLVIYKRVFRTIKELENLFKVSKSKWEMALAKASEESVKEAIPDDNTLAVQTSHSSMSTISDVKVVMTTSHTAITPFEVDIPKVSESTPAINTNTSPLTNEEQPPAAAETEPEAVEQPQPEAPAVKQSPSETTTVEPKLSSPQLSISETKIEMKDVATECYLKKKRRKSVTRRTTFGTVCDFSSNLLKELQDAFKAIPKMSYVILVTFYALP